MVACGLLVVYIRVGCECEGEWGTRLARCSAGWGPETDED